MDDNSFKSNDSYAIKTLLKENEFLTHFTHVESMIHNSKPCQIKILWKSPSPSHASIAFPKGKTLLIKGQYAGTPCLVQFNLVRIRV